MSATFVKLPDNALGCVIEQMNTLGQHFRQAIEELETVFKGIDSKISTTTWAGPDANKAEGDWNNTRTQTMNQLRSLMEAMSTAINNQASQQTQASS